VFFTLRFLEIDLVLRVDESSALTKSSTPHEIIKHERYERFNQLSLFIYLPIILVGTVFGMM
jgi:hypothetical protein